MYWLLVLLVISYQCSKKYCQYKYRKSIAVLQQFWKSIGSIVNTNTILQFSASGVFDMLALYNLGYYYYIINNPGPVGVIFPL